MINRTGTHDGINVFNNSPIKAVKKIGDDDQQHDLNVADSDEPVSSVDPTAIRRVNKTQSNFGGESNHQQYREEDLHPDDNPGNPTFKFEHIDLNHDNIISDIEFDQYLSLHGISPPSHKYALAWSAFNQMKDSEGQTSVGRAQYINNSALSATARITLSRISADSTLLNILILNNSLDAESIFEDIAILGGYNNLITKDALKAYLIHTGMGPKLASHIADETFALPCLSKTPQQNEKVIFSATWIDLLAYQHIINRASHPQNQNPALTLNDILRIISLGAYNAIEGKTRGEFFTRLYQLWIKPLSNTNDIQRASSLFLSILCSLNGAIDIIQRSNKREIDNNSPLNARRIIDSLRGPIDVGITEEEGTVYIKLVTIASCLGSEFIDCLEFSNSHSTQLEHQAVLAAITIYVAAYNLEITKEAAENICSLLSSQLSEQFMNCFNNVAINDTVTLPHPFNLKAFLDYAAN